jgi:hypothetical protein
VIYTVIRHRGESHRQEVDTNSATDALRRAQANPGLWQAEEALSEGWNYVIIADNGDGPVVQMTVGKTR